VGHAYLVRDRREVVALRRQLLVAARLAAVGDLAKAISRSINEPVGVARGELEGLSIDWRTGEDVVELMAIESECREAVEEGIELIEESIEGMERICSVVREVSGFASDADREPFAPHALDQIVWRACRIARVQAPRELEIDIQLQPDVRILCHAAEVERVVTNLIVNSIHALDGRGFGDAHMSVTVMSQGPRALLHIEDDGAGIEPENLDRIFDPFFTTKPVGKGTGLGLAISYHIVKAHGGEIRIDSIPGRGTSVSVELPLAPSEPSAG
jgi:signal transduction histidine kinase